MVIPGSRHGSGSPWPALNHTGALVHVPYDVLVMLEGAISNATRQGQAHHATVPWAVYMTEVALIALWSFIAIVAVWDAARAVRRAWKDNSSTHFQVTVICILSVMIVLVVLWR